MAKRVSGNVTVDVQFKDGVYSGRVSVKGSGAIFSFNDFKVPSVRKLAKRPSGSDTYDLVASGAIKRAARYIHKANKLVPFYPATAVQCGDPDFILTRVK